MPIPIPLRTRARDGLAAALAWLAAAACWGAPPRLSMPSPDWRDQIVYFVLTDRFANGDPANDDQRAGEFGAGRPDRYNGGDFAGLLKRLDYIQGLGTTALWITPPVAQQWLDPLTGYTGYHGYWAEDFMRVDAHLGTLADLRRLSDALHRRGMALIQDIVVNHTGNYFAYRGGWDPSDPTRFWIGNPGSRPHDRPTQPPFDLIDPRDPKARAAGIYHWTPDITDFADPAQVLDFQMSGLDDLNTENPAVRRALRRSYGWWIREAGVDAFRVDTAFYVPPDFFEDFLHARDPRAPGIAEVARRSGRRDFLVFGEGFGIDRPFDDEQERRIERYMSGDGVRGRMTGMLDFPLYGALNDVFARGRPTAELAWRIDARKRLHRFVHRMPTFVDNHDVDRFLAGGSVAALRQALLATMTLPGIPVIYYGTEQGFTESRAAMFAAGFGSGGRDRYDRSAPLYRLIAELSALRRGHPAFSRGDPQVLAQNPAGPGAIAWRVSHAGETLVVALNTSDGDTLLDALDTGVAAGTAIEGLYGLDGRPAELVAGPGGRVSLVLPPRAGVVWRVGAPRTDPPAAPAPTLEGLPTEPARADFDVAGRAAPGAELRVVVDGELGTAAVTRAGEDGRWRQRIDTSRFVDPGVVHRVVAWDGSRGTVSEAGHFRVARDWRLAAQVDDPAGDDHGPTGRYRAPPDDGYAALRPLDIRHVTALTAGGALRLEIGMAGVSTRWNPPNGFDHIAFTVFVELPGQPGGATVMPLQDAALPAGMRWHRRLRVHGWSNALFDWEGADAAHEGRRVTPAAAIEVDRGANTVRLTLPAASLGGLGSLAGARVYVTTWDYDGGYRPIAEQPSGAAFGGGHAGDPKVMDDTAVIELR